MPLPSPDIDLTEPAATIARKAGVASSTAYKWKLAAGIPMRRGRRLNPAWSQVTDSDWQKGDAHVAAIVGLSVAAVRHRRRALDPSGLAVAPAAGEKSVPKPKIRLSGRAAKYDLSLSCAEIARAAGISRVTAYKWKHASGISMRAGRPKSSRWEAVTDRDWDQGVEYVAGIVGLTKAGVWSYGYRQGHLPRTASEVSVSLKP